MTWLATALLASSALWIGSQFSDFLDRIAAGLRDAPPITASMQVVQGCPYVIPKEEGDVRAPQPGESFDEWAMGNGGIPGGSNVELVLHGAESGRAVVITDLEIIVAERARAVGGVMTPFDGCGGGVIARSGIAYLDPEPVTIRYTDESGEKFNRQAPFPVKVSPDDPEVIHLEVYSGPDSLSDDGDELVRWFARVHWSVNGQIGSSDVGAGGLMGHGGQLMANMGLLTSEEYVNGDCIYWLDDPGCD